MEKKDKPKGFTYYISDEKLREFARWTMEEKLQWLEEVNQFAEMFMSPKAKKIREMFKKGEI